MKEYTAEFLRNIALVSHGSGGKTMLAEAFLHATGATTRLGKIDDGTTTSDFEEEEIRRKLFHSFFSTKGPQGTGLGLMVTRKAVEEHGGRIEVASEPGRGTTFTVRLPCRAGRG